MTPQEFLEQIVLPNVREAHAAPLDLRRALNAVHAVDALAAHVAWALGPPCDSRYRQLLADEQPTFGLLRDTAKAAKHVRLKFGQPRLRSADRIASDGIGFGEGGFGEGFGGGDALIVEEDDRSRHDLLGLIDAAVSLLTGKIETIPR